MLELVEALRDVCRLPQTTPSSSTMLATIQKKR
jgi:hypothetical protein